MLKKLFLPNPKKLYEKGNLKGLLQATQHKNDEVKRESLNAIYELLKNNIKIQGIHVAEKLRSMDAGKILLNQLCHDWPIIRQRTIQNLGLLEDKNVAHKLKERINQEQDLIIIRALIIALGNLKVKEAVNDLLIFAEGKDPLLSISAAEALEKIGDPRTVQVLINVLHRQIKQRNVGIVECRGILFKYCLQLTEILKNTSNSKHAIAIIELINEIASVPGWTVENTDAKNLLDNLSWVLKYIGSKAENPVIEAIISNKLDDEAKRTLMKVLAKITATKEGTNILMKYIKKDVGYNTDKIHIDLEANESMAALELQLYILEDPEKLYKESRFRDYIADHLIYLCKSKYKYKDHVISVLKATLKKAHPSLKEFIEKGLEEIT